MTEMSPCEAETFLVMPFFCSTADELFEFDHFVGLALEGLRQGNAFILHYNFEWVSFCILDLDLCSFNRINRLINKRK